MKILLKHKSGYKVNFNRNYIKIECVTKCKSYGNYMIM